MILTTNKGIEFQIDDEDYDIVSRFSWNLDHKGYVVALSSYLKLHRLVMRICDSKIFIDHINMDKLDCRKLNLRVCTNSQNMSNRLKTKRNTSGYKGVSWHKSAKKWMASIRFNSKSIYLGLYDDPKDAFDSYKKKSLELQGEFARFE